MKSQLEQLADTIVAKIDKDELKFEYKAYLYSPSRYACRNLPDPAVVLEVEDRRFFPKAWLVVKYPDGEERTISIPGARRIRNAIRKMNKRKDNDGIKLCLNAIESSNTL